MKTAIYLVAAFLFLHMCFTAERVSGGEDKITRQKIVFPSCGLTITAEKAESEQKRQRGLMGRKTLKDREGMIFYFDETTRHAFWMFKTLIPLAVVFLDENLVVVDIQFMDPCISPKSEDCPVYVSRRPSRFAIEINQKMAKRYKIGVGERVKFQDS